jgi:transcriptional regulator with XRE-family HTH domain
MKPKIPYEVDQKILIALALGESNKSIARRLGVSTSYISKVKTGKKLPSIKLEESTTIKTEFFKADSVSLTELLIALDNYDLIADVDNSIIEYIETQMKKCLIQAKAYQIILNKIKEKK